MATRPSCILHAITYTVNFQLLKQESPELLTLIDEFKSKVIIDPDKEISFV